MTDIVSVKNTSEKVLQIAASLEEHSSHVIGLSIVRYAREQKVKLAKVEKFKNIAGKGIYGRVGEKEYYIGNRALMEDQKVYNSKAEGSYKDLSAAGKTIIFLANNKEIIGIL